MEAPRPLGRRVGSPVSRRVLVGVHVLRSLCRLGSPPREARVAAGVRNDQGGVFGEEVLCCWAPVPRHPVFFLVPTVMHNADRR